MSWICANCGYDKCEGKFCPECGAVREAAMPQPDAVLSEEGGWTCLICGNKENTGKFCRECGSPKGMKPRPLSPAPGTGIGIGMGIRIPAEPSEAYPTLEEVRAVKEEHGRLVSAEWSAFSGGMMMNSSVQDSMRLYRNEKGAAMLQTKHRQAYTEENEKLYWVDETIMRRMENLIRRENLAAWAKLRKKPEAFQQTDYSYSSSLTLCFDDAPLRRKTEGMGRRQIDLAAAREQGGDAVIDEILSLFKRCAQPGRLISEVSRKLAGPGMYMGMAASAAPATEGERKE